MNQINYITGHKALEILECHGWIPTGEMNGDVKQFKFTGNRPACMKDWHCWLNIANVMPIHYFINSLFAEIYPFYKVSGEVQEAKRIGEILKKILNYAKIEMVKDEKE